MLAMSEDGSLRLAAMYSVSLKGECMNKTRSKQAERLRFKVEDVKA